MTDHDKMKRAFEVVAPKDWRSAIDWRASQDTMRKRLAVAGVTLDDVCEAVVYFTATVPSVTHEGSCVVVRAAGYRAGPAGP